MLILSVCCLCDSVDTVCGNSHYFSPVGGRGGGGLSLRVI